MFIFQYDFQSFQLISLVLFWNTKRHDTLADKILEKINQYTNTKYSKEEIPWWFSTSSPPNSLGMNNKFANSLVEFAELGCIPKVLGKYLRELIGIQKGKVVEQFVLAETLNMVQLRWRSRNEISQKHRSQNLAVFYDIFAQIWKMCLNFFLPVRVKTLIRPS